jgi:hypothetical protein
VKALRELFEDRGVAAPSVNFESGMPFVQRIDGRTTFQLRKSWLKKADGSDNFPIKNDWDLLNHAQDAALIAACPPHTWRDTVFRVRASRPRWDGKWTEQDGLAVSELAPDWAEYLERRTWPLIKVLGRYPVSRKRKFADLTFSQNPDSLDDKRLVQYLPIANMLHSGKGPDDKRHPAETEIVNPTLDKKFRAVATALGIKRRQTLPETNLREEFPGIRHVKVRKQPGGRLVRVEPEDGPPRKVEVKGASEAVVFWVAKGGPLAKLRLSLRWPAILADCGVARYEPSIPDGARVLATWERYQFLRLGPEVVEIPGFYRVKEFDGATVTFLPENAMPDELAKRLNLNKRANAEESAQVSSVGQEVRLGKKALVKYFSAIEGEKRHDPRTAS